MAEGMYADVNALRSFNSEFFHRPINAEPHNIVRQVGFALGVGKEIAVLVRLVVLVETVAQVLREQHGHVNRRCAVIALRGAFLPSRVVQGASHPEDFALEVDATDFQRGHFADAKAADRGNEKHEFEGVGRDVDDLRGSVGVEEKDLRLRFFVSGEHDIPLLDVRDRVTPLSAEAQNRAESAVNILDSLPPIDTPTDSGYERLVLAEIQFKQRGRAWQGTASPCCIADFAARLSIMVQNQNGYTVPAISCSGRTASRTATVIFGVPHQASELGQRIDNEKFGIDALAFRSGTCRDGSGGNSNRFVEVKDS